MKMVLKGELTKVENKVSKKGNEYTVIDLMQPDNRYEYFRVMVDKEIEVNEENVGSFYVAVLDYNVRFKSFKVIKLENADEE